MNLIKLGAVEEIVSQALKSILLAILIQYVANTFF